MQSLLWEGPTIRIFPVAAPRAEILRMVGPSLELIDLVNGLHEGLFLFTEFCFPRFSKVILPAVFTFFLVYLFEDKGYFHCLSHETA